MQIKIKYPNEKGIIRIENEVEIKEVMINEDILHPENEIVKLGFVNDFSSGLIELNSKEIDRLMNTIKNKTHLIKDIKIFREKNN